MSPSTAHIWLKAEVLVPEAARDDLTLFFWDRETVGTEEESRADRVAVRAYFAVPEGQQPDRAARDLETDLRRCLDRIGASGSPLAVGVANIDPGEWLKEWRTHFRGFPIGASLWIHPPWESPSADRLSIAIEPGHAFGTGTHESTQLCLMELENLPPRTESFLDAGTGSGILACVAKRLHPGLRVAAFDNDPETPSAARRTFALNQTPDILLFCGPPSCIRGDFNLVAANLTQAILRQTAEDLMRLASDRLVVSGFTVDQSDLVRGVFEDRFDRVHSRELQGWSSLVMRRRAS